MGLRHRIVNGLIRGSVLADSRRFWNHTDDVESVQDNLLKHYLVVNRDTDFGKESGFSRIDSYQDFLSRIPVRDYEEFLPFIDSIRNGRPSVLTSDPVLLLEPTSGSTSATKLIPYTSTLRQEFQRAVNVWLADLYRHYPGISRGTHYWSISPANSQFKALDSMVPIGFEDDMDYLGLRGRLLRIVLTAESGIREETDLNRFWFRTALALLRDSHLALVSVWSPTFLSIILDTIVNHYDELLRCIATGTVCSGGAVRPDPERARYLEACPPDGDILSGAMWPGLELVSCWTDGPSARFSESLRRRLPGISVQGKGLLATEGIMTFPVEGLTGKVPAYMSHFLEFQDEHGTIFRLNELKADECYSVIITTGGGLVRYRMGDIVRVAGRFRNLPLLEFTGRDRVSDFTGEKINGYFIEQCTTRALVEESVDVPFWFIAGEISDDDPIATYVLFIERPVNGVDRQALARACRRIEIRLLENFHYQHSRQLGQLAPFSCRVEPPGLKNRYLERHLESGAVAGDVKVESLSQLTGWVEYLGENLS